MFSIQSLSTSNISVEVLAKSLIGSAIADTNMKLDWRVNGTNVCEHYLIIAVLWIVV